MAPEHSLEVPEGPGSAPEVSGMSRNGPGMSRKLLEASRRSWKVPDSTTHSPSPLALGGKPPRQPWPARRGEAHQGGGNPPPSGIAKSIYGRFPVGRCGKVWKAWESKLDSQTSLGCSLGFLATYIKGAKGGGREHTSLRRPRLSLVASCSTVRPRFRALI